MRPASVSVGVRAMTVSRQPRVIEPSEKRRGGLFSMYLLWPLLQRREVMMVCRRLSQAEEAETQQDIGRL